MDKTARHTPGPWTMIRGTLGTAQFHIAEMMPSAYPDMPPCFAPAEQQEANARLIAAAPDLLAALEICETLLADLEMGGAENPELKISRAAIAKAGGV